MKDNKCFFDTNILLYLLSSDIDKAEAAEKLLCTGGYISVQIVNELTNVMLKKFKMSWNEIEEFISLIKSICDIVPLTIEISDSGRDIAQRYRFSLYDSMIVSAAYASNCSVLYSEDMHNGISINDNLKIINPFI